MTTMQAGSVERLYRAGMKAQFVQVPRLSFLAVDGRGDPDTSPAFAGAVQALYAVSYAAKFMFKKDGGPDFTVSKLEGLWWADDPGKFTAGDKSDWEWTLLIRQPDALTSEVVERLINEVAAKKALAGVRDLSLISFEEGAAAQVLHVGPYATEAPTIVYLHAFLRDHGCAFDGHLHKHHEIYLNDPRRAAPEKLRTIIRQPYAARSVHRVGSVPAASGR
jgi:hypothetical protein